MRLGSVSVFNIDWTTIVWFGFIINNLWRDEERQRGIIMKVDYGLILKLRTIKITISA